MCNEFHTDFSIVLDVLAAADGRRMSLAQLYTRHTSNIFFLNDVASLQTSDFTIGTIKDHRAEACFKLYFRVLRQNTGDTINSRFSLNSSGINPRVPTWVNSWSPSSRQPHREPIKSWANFDHNQISWRLWFHAQKTVPVFWHCHWHVFILFSFNMFDLFWNYLLGLFTRHSNDLINVWLLVLNSGSLSPLQGAPGCEYCRITGADIKDALGFTSIQEFGSKSETDGLCYSG